MARVRRVLLCRHLVADSGYCVVSAVRTFGACGEAFPKFRGNLGFLASGLGDCLSSADASGICSSEKATGELEKSVFVLKCSLMPNYMRFYSDASPGMDHLVHYGDVHRLLGVGRNLFFWFTWEKMAMYQIIPSAAFESYQEYRQVKADIKRRIKQQGSGKQKSVLGSFFGGAFSLWLDYIKAVVKALAVVMAVLLCIGLVGTVIKKMKG